MTISKGLLLAVGSGYSVIDPEIEIRPTRFWLGSVNQKLWSDPNAIPIGCPPDGSANSVTAPVLGFSLAIAVRSGSANHTFFSRLPVASYSFGPATKKPGPPN